ncbi:MAG: RdgB/HAM1 family non-canonical purine NTP pyrophosphatase [Bacteroidales bacterium]|nr:RdgB/HAM1 family non-canonical purine NTP pyrophosphatase [Bacteroidales bacterium]
MQLVFATNNRHKLFEARNKLLNTNIDIISLNELNFDEEIEETSDTIEGNAKIKADCINNRFSCDVFADDTGLEVECLHGAPGVYSSRYAGEHVSYEDNVTKLLYDMQGAANRKARFRTCIHLILNNQHFVFEGIVNGKIIAEAHGKGGFGYDPIFVPEGFSQTFAELPLDVKNSISHRGKALDLLATFLSTR